MHVSLLDTDAVPPPRKSLVIGVVVVVIAVICGLDRLTAPFFSFTPLYLLPIAAAAWLAGWPAAALASVVAASFHLGGHLWAYGGDASRLPLVWDALSLLAMFLFFVWFVAWLHRAIDRAIRDARIDTVTGLARRGVFVGRGRWELARAARYARSLTIAYIDVDHFKAVNDQFGHEAGDRVLSTIGALLQKSVRTFDLVARLGGDEFGLLLPETNEAEAAVLLKRLRAKVGEAARPDGQPITVSIGAVTTASASDVSFEALLAHADALMYEVKKSTRDGMRQETFSGTQAPCAAAPERVSPRDPRTLAPHST